jgi:polyribonucleotide nucleotidyltransferase
MFKNTPVTHTFDFLGQKYTLETGLLANQATSAVLASIGQTTVLATVVIGQETNLDYLPLQVIYEERMYASGKIKGSRFQKREGRPSETAILTGRMIDRSLRSLFDPLIRQEIQVVVTVLSLDEVNPPDTLSVLAASAALTLANVEGFNGPVASIRVGYLENSVAQYFVHPLTTIVEKAGNFAELRPILQEIAQSVDENNPSETQVLKQIFSIVGRKNPEWAAKFRLLYKTTPKLPKGEVLEKYAIHPNLVFNPDYETIAQSSLDLVISGSGQNIVMVEAGARIVDESIFTKAFFQAGPILGQLINFQKEFRDMAETKGLARQTPTKRIKISDTSLNYWSNFAPQLEEILYQPGANKTERHTALSDWTKTHKEALQLTISRLSQTEERPNELIELSPEVDPKIDHLANFISQLGFNTEELQLVSNDFDLALYQFSAQLIKQNILQKDRRLDGRSLTEVRQISAQVGVLPRTHGSSLFQRGQTQVLNVLTLGTARDALTLDDMEDFEETTKRYIHHYNFPAYSVGEIGRYNGPGRREIGHGALAEKALLPVLPSEEEFPYTVRLVSECLSSNGSTSMAATCASTLSLLDGGVPIKDLVAGVAMGLVINQTDHSFKILTDIIGSEDHFGDMDFKVAGTKDGITALQLDNKVSGLTPQILSQALVQSKQARLHILSIMQEAIATPRTNLSPYAPRVVSLQIPVEKIGEVIGPGGKIIKTIIQKFEVEIDIEDNTGKTFIYGKDSVKIQGAKTYIENLIRDYKVGDTVNAIVFRIESYGAFVKIDGTDKDGLIHISQLANRRVAKPEDVVQIGSTVQAKVLEVNDKGQISLTLKF